MWGFSRELEEKIVFIKVLKVANSHHRKLGPTKGAQNFISHHKEEQKRKETFKLCMKKLFPTTMNSHYSGNSNNYFSVTDNSQ